MSMPNKDSKFTILVMINFLTIMKKTLHKTQSKVHSKGIERVSQFTPPMGVNWGTRKSAINLIILCFSKHGTVHI